MHGIVIIVYLHSYYMCGRCDIVLQCSSRVSSCHLSFHTQTSIIRRYTQGMSLSQQINYYNNVRTISAGLYGCNHGLLLLLYPAMSGCRLYLPYMVVDKLGCSYWYIARTTLRSCRTTPPTSFLYTVLMFGSFMCNVTVIMSLFFHWKIIKVTCMLYIVST